VVAHRLGIVAPGAYDLNAACAGFCYAIASASDAIRTGTARHVLVIGSEKMTAWVDPTDRSTSIIFADGAGAAVVGPVADGEPPGIGPVAWGSAGDMAEKIIIADRNSFLQQEGLAVFRWTTTTLHPIAAQACERAGVAVSELSAFVPHQANLRIVEAIARRLGVPRERVVWVEPLPVPAEDETDPDVLARNPAVELFLSRARVSRPEIEATPTNAALAATICRRLDGIPLAIELAAAALRVLAPTTTDGETDG